MTPLTPFTPQQLQACLARLGLPPQPPAATLQTLERLVDAALHHLPFENLDVLLARPVAIEPEAVFSKVVEGGRGGYCFELNSLFARLLASLGYRISLLVARVRWGMPAEVERTQQSHLLLRIELDEGPYLADVGFGGANPPRPLPLVIGEERPGGWRIAPHDGDELELALHAASGWQALYRFTLQAQHWVDYLPRNWYTSTHPDSVFRKSLRVALSEGGTRLTLLDGQFGWRDAKGNAGQRRILDVDELIEVLRGRFHLRLPPATAEALREPLARLL